ncbi:MAG: Ig-like domain-containing protein [Clostridia bacterium]|nr:Ig-like domain-containing protein [Clostridia bacterium]
MRIKRILSVLMCALFMLSSLGINAVAATETVTVNVGMGEEYTLPADITWNENYTVDTSAVGYQLFEGTDASGASVTYRVNVGEWTDLISDDYESYQESEYVAAVDKNINGGKFFKAAYNAEDESTHTRLVKEGDSTVLAIGPGKAGWSSTRYFPTDKAVGENFNISVKVKAASLDLNTSANSSRRYVFFQLQSHNTPMYTLRTNADAQGNITKTELRYEAAGSTFVNEDISEYVSWSETETAGIYKMDEYILVELIGNSETYMLKIDGNIIAQDVAWGGDTTSPSHLTNYGVDNIAMAKRVTASDTNSIAYIDELKYAKPVYPQGNVPDNISTTVETGTTGNMTTSFNLVMSDGSSKNITVYYTLNADDTAAAGAITVNGTAEGFNFNIPISVNIEDAPVVIESIDNLSKNVSVGDEFTLPATVTANMSDGSTQEVAIVWNGAASTENKGVYTFTGTVADYSGTVTYTLTVEALCYMNVIAGQGEDYALPAAYNGYDIIWDGETQVDTTYIGRQSFTGSLSSGDALICTVNVGEQNVLIFDDMESYTVGGDRPDYEVAGGLGGLSLTEGNDIVYEEGIEGNKVAQVSDSKSWGSFKLISPESSKYDYIISGRVKQLSTEPKSGVSLIAYNDPSLGRLEVCGMRINMDSSNGKLNVRNGIKNNATTGANPEALQLKGKQFDDWTNKWIDFSILVDKNAGTYSVFANGHDIRLDTPFNQTAVTDPSFKVIEIVGTNGVDANGETVKTQIYFDDLKVTEYKYVIGELPETLYDSVVSGINAEREQLISLKMNDGTMQQFAVKYTIDPTQSGKQTVVGKIDGFSETIEVTVDVDARTIESIKPESCSNVEKIYVGNDYTLPSSIIAVMSEADESGSNEKEMSVTWNGVADTSKAGVFTYTGTVNGYDNEVIYTLTVSEDKPVSVEPIEETLSLNEAYSFPTTVPVLMESGKIKYMEVNWGDSIARTDVAGETTYSGYVIGYPEIVGNDGVLVSLRLTVEESAIAAADYPDGKTSFDIIVKNVSDLPEKIGCVYENGMKGFETVTWDTTSIGTGTGPFTITGSINADNLKAGFDGKITANVSFFNVPTPALEDGLDTFKWPFGDYMFPVGATLRYKQYPPNNSTLFRCAEDPENPENKILKYENNPEYSSNDTKVYNGLALSQAKGGFLVAETDIKLPRNFTYTRFRLLTGMSKEFCVIDLYGDKSMKVRNVDVLDNAIPLDEWFKLTIATDTTATKAEDRYYDIYVNGVHVCRAPWYQDPSETNGVGQGVLRFDFRNDTEDSFIMYLDNIKLYFLNDLMADAYTQLESINTVVERDKIELPTALGNTNIIWSSSDESVIAADGTVTRPAYNMSNKNVTMTAELSQQAGIFAANDIKQLSFKVMKVGATDEDLVAETIKRISVPASTSSDIKLLKGYGNAEVKWESSNDKVIDSEGRVYPVDKDTEVKLTATITCGNVTETKTYAVKVIHTETLTDLQKVRKAMAGVEIPETISEDVDLPSSVDGVEIIWISNSLSVINSDGSLVSSRPSSATATLMATFTYGSVYETKEYTFTVTKASSSNGGGGGGGGSTGGNVIKSNAIQTVPTITQTPSVPAEKFNDLGSHEWAKEAVYALGEKGIIKGVSENAFAPNANVKREEFAAMIVRLAKLEATNNVNVFSDVTENDWFFKEISAAFENGIINGMSEKTFGAGVNITRQDIAVILCNLAKKYGIDTKTEQITEFADFDDTVEYAKEAIAFLSAAGVINGSDGKLLPLKNATRAEAAKMLYEFIRIFDIENSDNTTEEQTVNENIEDETNNELTE